MLHLGTGIKNAWRREFKELKESVNMSSSSISPSESEGSGPILKFDKKKALESFKKTGKLEIGGKTLKVRVLRTGAGAEDLSKMQTEDSETVFYLELSVTL